MAANELYIRADASIMMGTGHIMRCIALGQAFKKKGGMVYFISNCKNKILKSRIHDEGFIFFNINQTHPYPDDIKETLAIMINESLKNKGKNKVWTVLDGYHFNPDYQKDIKNAGFKLLVIDDYNHQPFYHADMVLNQNIGAEIYKYKTNSDTIILAGTKYAMLRNEFLKKNRSQTILHNATRILITLGGSDPGNITLKFIKALQRINDTQLKVKVLIGPSNPNKQKIESSIKSQNNIYLIQNGDVPSLMRWADLAITASGSTCWELCYTGVPFMTIITAENQERIALSLEKTGAAENLGWFSKITLKTMTDAIQSLINNAEKREKMARHCKELVDGKGTIRILQQMGCG